MCDLVFLDLERTIIEDGSPSLIINEDKLKGILFSRRVVIYSFMIENKNDPMFVELERLFNKIESIFKCHIIEHIFLDDVVKSVQNMTAIKFDPHEISSLGKEYGLQTILRLDNLKTKFKSALFVDDRIENGLEFKIHGKHVKCVNIDRIRFQSK